jgi:hypothetical protein
MKIFIGFVLWCLLFLLCWPLAVLVFPLVWLVLLPFRLVFFVVEGLFGLIRAILCLPARLLAYSKTKA